MGKARSAEPRQEITRSADRPWVANYPPLKEWLGKIQARCMDQIPAGDNYVEQWMTPNGRNFLVLVRAYKLGWDVYTNCGSNGVAATLDDAGKRLEVG